MKNEHFSEDLLRLAEELKKSTRIAVLGVGSELMQDDKAGVDVTAALEKKFGCNNPRIKFFSGYTSPENFTGDIVKYNPSHLIIIDAADINLNPGEFTLLPVELITDFSLGTHKMSLIMMIRYIKETIDPVFSVIAIQYKSVLFSEKMTSEMRSGVKKVTCFLSGIIETL